MEGTAREREKGAGGANDAPSHRVLSRDYAARLRLPRSVESQDSRGDLVASGGARGGAQASVKRASRGAEGVCSR